MKTKLFLLILLPFFVSAQDTPQKFTYKLGSSSGTIQFNIEKAKVHILGYSGTDIQVEARNVTPVPEEAKGLKPVGKTGTDNSGVGLSFQAIATGGVQISTVLRQGDDVEYLFKIPKNFNIRWKKPRANLENSEGILIENLSGKVEVETLFQEIELREVTGPVMASSDHATIRAVFSTVNQTKPISISSTHGNVDVSLPQDTKAELKIDTDYGNAFSDFDILTYTDSSASKLKKSVRVNGYRSSARAGVPPPPPAPPSPPRIATITADTLVFNEGSEKAASSSNARDAKQLRLGLSRNAEQLRSAIQDAREQIESGSVDSFTYTNNNYYDNDCGCPEDDLKSYINAKGGVKITLKSNFGNIFLRKKN